MLDIVWTLMVLCGVVAMIGHVIAEKELRRSEPHSRGLGWFGPGPSSSRGRNAYFVKRLFTALAIVAAAVAIAIGVPTVP